jgi:glycosyltransferase involved in cell wall biosynthesis
MDISIVVPVYNEEESLKELTIWISKVMKYYRYAYEIIMVDDGSVDNSWNVISGISQKNSNVKGVSFRRNYGKSAALQKGFELASGEVVITMDADLQDSPDEIPELYKMIKYDGYDMVSGWKKKRHDPIHKRWPSKFYNKTVRAFSGIKLHDFNCGLKAYRKDVVKSIEVYGEMHRYIPVIAKWAGFKNIGEKVVNHHARKFGKSKFGMERYFKGYLDLLTISFISRYGRRPMHFFGLIGTLLFLAGFIIAIYLAYQKIANQVYYMTTRPLFYFGLLAMILGTILFVGGFLGELISRNGSDRNRYHLKNNIGFSKSDAMITTNTTLPKERIIIEKTASTSKQKATPIKDKKPAKKAEIELPKNELQEKTVKKGEVKRQKDEPKKTQNVSTTKDDIKSDKTLSTSQRRAKGKKSDANKINE